MSIFTAWSNHGYRDPTYLIYTKTCIYCTYVGSVGVRANAFHPWVCGFDSRFGLMRKESVNALPKVVGFLRVLWFPPTGKVDSEG
jgi:hypothetical protein